MANIAGLILPYNGNHATIPSNWSRVTGLDAKVLKAAGAEAVGTSGGSDTHVHASSAHTHAKTDAHYHAVSYQASGACASYGGSPNQDPIAQCNHNHSASNIGGNSTFVRNSVTYNQTTGGAASNTIAYPSTALNNLPPFHEVIFVKASAGATLQQHHVIFSNINEIPVGWQIPDGTNGTPDIRNRYLRGAGTAANAGTQGGSLTHTHNLSHSHSTTHYHEGVTGGDDNHPTRTNGGGGGGNKTGSHDHYVILYSATVSTDTYSGSVTSGTVEPEYYKLLALYNMGNGPLKKGMIGMWEDSSGSIPAGLLLCDGRAWTDGLHTTPDLRNKYIKIANDGTEIGATGGSNTHAHAASNSHTHVQAGAHSHTGGMGAEGGGTASGGSTSPGSHTHGFASIGNNSTGMTWGAATMAGESVSNQPAYKTIYYVQIEKVGTAAGVLMNLLESE